MSSQAIRTEQLPAVKVPLIPGALDGQILLIYGVLTLIGLIMVTSASITAGSEALYITRFFR